jgi:hypothetical protein
MPAGNSATTRTLLRVGELALANQRPKAGPRPAAFAVRFSPLRRGRGRWVVLSVRRFVLVRCYSGVLRHKQTRRSRRPCRRALIAGAPGKKYWLYRTRLAKHGSSRKAWGREHALPPLVIRRGLSGEVRRGICRADSRAEPPGPPCRLNHRGVRFICCF